MEEKNPCLSPLSPGTQGVFLHSQTLSALFLTEAYGECLGRHGKTKVQENIHPRLPPTAANKSQAYVNLWPWVPPFPMTNPTGETEAVKTHSATYDSDKGFVSGAVFCTGM